MKIKHSRLVGVLLLKSLLTTLVVLLMLDIVMRFIEINIFVYNSQQYLGGLLKVEGAVQHNVITLYNIYSANKVIRNLSLGVFIFSVALAIFTIKEFSRSLRLIAEAMENVKLTNKETIKLNPEMEYIEERLNLLQLELRDSEVRAEVAKRRRSEMVMFLAHDLKTPLTSVIAYLSILQSDSNLPAEERVKYTDIVYDKSKRLQQLIEEFFQISKYHMQDIELDTEVFDISVMLEQITDEIGGVLEERNLSCHLDAQENISIEGDPNKLARVFDNILRNAMNYCYSGSEIKITVEEINKWVEIIISNEGEPIPESKLSTIFEKFYRLDDARSSITGGSGLGLAISREIIELHKGMIFAQSNPRETSFIIRIPVIHQKRLH